MRTIKAFAVMLGVFATVFGGPAFAQILITPGGGGGIVPPPGGAASTAVDSGGIPTQVSLHDNVIYYNWQENAAITAASATGWKMEESTSGLLSTISPRPPFLFLAITQTSPRRFRLWEQGFINDPLNLTKDEHYRVVFSIFNIDALGTVDDDACIYVSFGDTTWIGIDGTPDSFGIIAAGTNISPGTMAENAWHGFVGDGSDTTYLDLSVAVGNENKFYIEAHNGGGVDFWVNDVYRGSITTPTRSTNPDTGGMSFWFQNDSVAFWSELGIGPIMIQREWD